MNEYIKFSDVMKIYKNLYISYGATAISNIPIPVFIDLLRTVAVELPEPPKGDDVGCRMSKWISVKDRLPEPFEDVLTYDGKCKIIINWLEEIEDGIPYFVYSGKTVTHWMPLPKLPESESEDGR